MKPIKLEMTAFGSYGEKTLVDFERLDHGLYLITGDTGAGKTTIFDAIMFALYGEASGAQGGRSDGKARTFEMMHCDYVDKSVDTVVDLTFSHAGKTHRVERIFHFKKSRRTGEYEKTTPAARFWEEGRDVIEKTDAVTARIEHLLGMNAEQFSKIVMLAQGQFKRFLDADSEEKNRILGELFDSSSYVYFQRLLDEARNRLRERRREEGFDRIARAMENFLWPEDMETVQVQEAYSTANPGLAQTLKDLAEAEHRYIQELEEQRNICQKQENDLHRESVRAEENNKKLQEQEQKTKHLKELEEKEPDYIQLAEQTSQVEQVFYKIRPCEEHYERARKVCEDTRQEIEQLSKQITELRKDQTEKESMYNQCRKTAEPMIRQLEVKLSNIEKNLPEYAELEKRRVEEKGAKEELGKLSDSRAKAETKQQQAAGQCRLLEEEILQKSGADVRTVRLEGECNEARRRLDKLMAKDGIRDQADQIRKKEQELVAEQKKLGRLAGEAGRKEVLYHELYQTFIEGQAGLMARELEEELEERGEAFCPVCRTRFAGKDHPPFAKSMAEIPRQKDVDKAKKAFEEKDHERELQSREITRLEESLAGRKAHMLAGLRELEPECPDWDGLKDGKYLDDAIAASEKAWQRLDSCYKEAKEQARKLEGLRKALKEKQEEVESLQEKSRQYQEAEQGQRELCGRLETAIEELERSLEYPDEVKAKEQLGLWRKEKEQLSHELEKSRKAYEKAKSSSETADGNRKGRLEMLPGLEADLDKAEERLEAALIQYGFRDLKEAHKAAALAGDTDSQVEAWISSGKKAVTDYKNQRGNIQNRLEELEKETKNLTMADLTLLAEQIQETEALRKSLQEKLDVCRDHYQNHQKTADVVETARRVLDRTQEAWERLDHLANLAVGANSEGGKLSFDRYVMGYVFREVLEMANQRLDIMSGGRYELIHEVNAGKANAKAGLEIVVLDMGTGKCRPASSLSGGESFFVSLALALGLSDVVQNHVGGNQLDALFIDEGFGSLDGDVLDRALSVLNQLTRGQRLVGIISHVARLEESIPQQIRVKKGQRGSSLQVVT